MSRSETHDPSKLGAPSGDCPDFAQTLEQHVRDGLSPELALDLVLHDLVVFAANSTHASAAALALARGEEMVCRAATGDHAPDLGVPLNTHDGFSGACLRSRQPQQCLDTETDPRVDAAATRRLGIRSMLVVPILDEDTPAGIIEVFAPQPAAFSELDDVMLEILARACVRLRQLSRELAEPSPQASQKLKDEEQETPPPGSLSGETPRAASQGGVPNPGFAESSEKSAGVSPAVTVDHPPAAELSMPQKPRAASDLWTMALGALVILSAAGLSFLVGSRTGWVRTFSSPQARTQTQQAAPSISSPVPHPAKPAAESSRPASSAQPASGSLVVYDHGKVIFRMKPGASPGNPPTPQRANGAAAAVPHVWLAPDAAETRLRQRIEPQYPADARAARRSGDVTLEVLVGDDGSVAGIRPVSGDPLLAAAAADAVRQWRYEPYRVKGHATGFQTDVTLKFSLPQ